jgi:hypothetical protein
VIGTVVAVGYWRKNNGSLEDPEKQIPVYVVIWIAHFIFFCITIDQPISYLKKLSKINDQADAFSSSDLSAAKSCL